MDNCRDTHIQFFIAGLSHLPKNGVCSGMIYFSKVYLCVVKIVDVLSVFRIPESSFIHSALLDTGDKKQYF